MSKKFHEVNGEASDTIKKFGADVATQLERTKYQVILNHKQMVMIVSWLEKKKGDLELQPHEKELLDVFSEASQK